MGSPGGGEDVVRQRGRVVGAHQPQRCRTVERLIQQLLVYLALDDLRRGSVVVHRLTDAAQLTAVLPVAADEITPHGQDARRVHADVAHVRHRHERARGDGVAQYAEIAGGRHGEDRFAVADRVLDERHCRGGEVGGAGIEHRLVPVPGRSARPRRTRSRRHSAADRGRHRPHPVQHGTGMSRTLTVTPSGAAAADSGHRLQDGILSTCPDGSPRIGHTVRQPGFVPDAERGADVLQPRADLVGDLDAQVLAQNRTRRSRTRAWSSTTAVLTSLSTPPIDRLNMLAEPMHAKRVVDEHQLGVDRHASRRSTANVAVVLGGQAIEDLAFQVRLGRG